MAAALSGCGPERDFTGVWQLESCDGRDGACDGDPFTYELHLGRFGDDVAGLLVQYRFQGADLESFVSSNDCGCYLLSSGRAGEETVNFGVRAAVRGCTSKEDVPDPALMCSEPPLILGCSQPLFALSGDDETLEGTVTCGEGRDADVYDVRFRAESGRPRTRCVKCEDG